jgi:hypothetical protein
VVDRAELLGRKLDVKGLHTSPMDKPIVLYSWTTTNLGFLRGIRELSNEAGVSFVGINVDQDLPSAKEIGDSLPGTQYYDGNGLDGPLASQLCLTFKSSLYILDDHGIVRYIDFHFASKDLILGLIKEKGRAE